MPVDLKKDEMGDVIKDFYKSDAPQFKGKSKEKRREMAIAAKLEAERGPQEATNFFQRDKIMAKAKSLHKHLYKSLHKKDTSGDVNEGIKTDMLRDRKYGKSVADKEKAHKERDARMKYGKRWKEFSSDANKAKSRLKPGEVRKFNKETGKWESNKS